MEEQDNKNMCTIVRAVQFAALKHRNQRRKDLAATPYINHPIEVADILRRCGHAECPILVAALLHDTVEDTGTTVDEILCNFGVEVASIVAEVTDDKSLPKFERKLLQIQHAPYMSRAGKLVKLADKLHNLTTLMEASPPSWSVEYTQGYFVWARAVIAGLRGTSESLERRLDCLFGGRFVRPANAAEGIPAISHPCIPEGADESVLLSNWIEKVKSEQ